MLWQVAALTVALLLVVAGVALIFPPAALIVAGLLVGAAALFVDPETLKGGKR